MRYRRITVRIPEAVASQVREIAELAEWQVADLQRSLILLGVTFFLLSYGEDAREEAAATLMGGMKLLKLSKSFRLHISHRPYPFRYRFRKSTLATLSLPESVCNLIEAYATLKQVSRNQVYSKCLQQGLLAYLMAQATALDTARSQQKVDSPLNLGSVAEEAAGGAVVG